MHSSLIVLVYVCVFLSGPSGINQAISIELNRFVHYVCLFFLIFQVQKGSPALKAGLEPFFDFILSIGNTRLVSRFKTPISSYIISYIDRRFLMTETLLPATFKLPVSLYSWLYLKSWKYTCICEVQNSIKIPIASHFMRTVV